MLYWARFSPPFPGISATVSIHLITSTAVLKLNSFFPISADEKGATSVFLGFWPIIRPLSLPSPSQAIHSDYYLYPVYHFFIHPVTECKHLLAFILTPICYVGREELTYIPYSSFNGQSLGNLLFLSSQW